MKYQPINKIEDVELAGCLPIANSKSNFVNIMHRLELILALCYTRQKSEDIIGQIEEEAEGVFVPFHEYVINEIQYEYRRSIASKFNEKYENEVLSKWMKEIVLRYNVEIADQFLGIIQINRTKRRR